MMIDNSLQTFSGHIQLQHPAYLEQPRMRYAINRITDRAQRLRGELELTSISARAAGFALVSSRDRSYGLQILGVDARHEPLVSTLPGLIRRGRYLEPGAREEIVIGSVLARNLRIDIGDELSFLGSGLDDSFAAGVVTVVGIFASGSADLDRSVAQVNLAYFQESFAMGDAGNSIVIRAAQIDDVGPLMTRLRAQLQGSDQVVARDWNDLQPGLRQAIRADMTSAWFMYAVLIVLVAFSVLNTQLMSVLERTREFGTMMALGLRPARLARLVMLETGMMTGVGLVLGIGLGVLITTYLSMVGFSYPGMAEMSSKFNLPERMYPQISLLSLSLGPLFVACGSLLAAIYPALRLNRLLPIEAMKAV
jgi:ABC-type lipoprotein release transport system permease subunit